MDEGAKKPTYRGKQFQAFLTVDDNEEIAGMWITPEMSFVDGLITGRAPDKPL